MIEVAIAILAMACVLIGVQSVVVALFVRCLWTFRRDDISPESLPEAVVVLAVRGRDPFLADTLLALAAQDYPRYAIHVVLDGEIDSGRSAIDSVIAQAHASNVTIDVLREPLASCTLKCSALRQAVGELQSRYPVIAFIDGDAIPYRRWLRDLVTPLMKDPAVGVTTGNRWYMPREANWGSLVRYYWNAGAVVQVWLNDIAWAGSMALRTDTIRRIDLLDAWSRALSVDNTVCRQVRRHGYRVCCVPATFLVNTERISLATFVVWVRRQLAGVKTSRKNWAIVLLHAGLLFLLQALPVVLVVGGLIRGELSAAAISGIALLGMWLFNFASAVSIEWAVRRIVRFNGGQTRWLRPRLLWKLFPAMLLTFLVYPLALAMAAVCRRVVWRGVEYELIGPNQVRMVKYRPFGLADESMSSDSVI